MYRKQTEELSGAEISSDCLYLLVKVLLVKASSKGKIY